MNPSALSTTETVDAVFLYIFGISALMLVGITVAMLWFVVKYGRKRHPRPEPSAHSNVLLETAWTVIPTLIVLTMFWYGWQGYTTLRNVPPDALTVQVSGRMWSWHFTYPDGKTSDRLVVPVGRAIRLEITSGDVLHSFYVPAFRIKMDAVPGMTTHAWFRAPAAGRYDAFCAEYCGVGHSAMITSVEAVSQEEFEKWYRQPPSEAAESEGANLLAQHGCIGCHSLDGSEKTGPTFQGLFGRQVTVVTEGQERTVTVDAEYIKRSILEPKADLVKGFPPVMPSFEGQLSGQEIEEIVEFFQAGGEDEEMEKKVEKKPVTEGASGQELLEEKGCLGCHSTDGSQKVGPTFKGLFGKQVTVQRGGKKVTVTADADYLRRSVREPQADIVEGFPAAMPQIELTEEELAAIVDYLGSLK